MFADVFVTWKVVMSYQSARKTCKDSPPTYAAHNSVALDLTPGWPPPTRCLSSDVSVNRSKIATGRPLIFPTLVYNKASKENRSSALLSQKKMLLLQ